MKGTTVPPAEAAAHLEPGVWAKVNRLLVAKALAELAHELLIHPAPVGEEGEEGEGSEGSRGAGWGQYRLPAGSGDVEYRFRARILALDHWLIDRRSIGRRERGEETALDALQLILDLGDRLAVPPEALPEYLFELASTLHAAAWKHGRPGLSAGSLARADFQAVETAMLEGHPIFLANNGRIGFDADDYRKYAPEATRPTALLWLAADRERAQFACVDGLSYDVLIQGELGAETRERFRRTLAEGGLDPERFLFLPVHPWQWENRLAQLFAADIALGHLVPLGPGDDLYLAQQSIRTFFNVSRPDRHYVKTALSILNMGFTRGISASLGETVAPVNGWAGDLVRDDPYLVSCRFSVLREIAFAGFRHRHFEAASGKRSDARKEMLAAIWRESPTARLGAGQRLMTMAALMHVDCGGVALLPALIRASGVGIDAWLRAYLRHYLKPLVHCFYAHNLLFTPHCENTLLILEGDVVVGVLLKDLAEDIGVVNPETDLPERVRRLALRVPEEVMTLGIFTDVFDCVFRFLAPILLEHAGYPEESFWALVAESIREYQAEHPRSAAKFRRYDLFAPTFIRNCLNRLQLRNHREMVDLNAPDPVDSLQFAGTLPNPIAHPRDAGPRSAAAANAATASIDSTATPEETHEIA